MTHQTRPKRWILPAEYKPFRLLRALCLGSFALINLSLLMVGCGPPWPLCQQDKDCYASRSGNTAKRQLFCIVKQCRECRTVADCPQAALHRCKGHQCIRKTCADITCPARKRCEPKTLTCKWICEQDGDTPCDGNPCQVCRQHQCIYKPPHCLTSEDCPRDQVCQQAGTCAAACGTGCDPIKCTFPFECHKGTCLKLCDLPPILFEPKTNAFSTRATQQLQALVTCLNRWTEKVLIIEAHDIDGKTSEFNIHRSLKRAKLVRDILTPKGIAAKRTCLVAMGQEQSNLSSSLSRKQKQKQHRISFRLANECP